MNDPEMKTRLIAHLKSKVDKPTFEAFIEPLELIKADAQTGEVHLEAPGEMAGRWLGQKLRGVVVEFFQDELGGVTPDLHIGVLKPGARKRSVKAEAVKDEAAPAPARKKAPPVSRSQEDKDLNLIPGYTFENFVVGKGNQLAHAAAMQVGQSPGKGNPYNPLYIYSNTGLGKTHLLHAIARHIQQRRPETVIRVLSAEMFMREFIEIIQQRKPFTQFRQKYRECDVLIIDDIQFVARGEATETEFFHTFNALYENGSQIILASDQHPLKISSLQERMATRLNWGLVVDIQPPDFETRLSILRNKCALMDLNVSDTVLSRIAQRVKTNVRELEGTLVKLSAHAKLMGKNLEDQVEELLADMFPNQPLTLQLGGEEIIQAVAEEYGLPISSLKSARRKKELVEPRHLAMYLVREHTQLPFEGIGELFGGRHYATVIKGVDKVRQQPSNRQSLAMSRIRERLGILLQAEG